MSLPGRPRGLAASGLPRNDGVGALLPHDRCEIITPPESTAAQPGLARVHCPRAECGQTLQGSGARGGAGRGCGLQSEHLSRGVWAPG